MFDAGSSPVNLKFALKVVEQIRERQLLSFKPVRMAILPTFTADLMIPYVRIHGAFSMMDIECYIGAFNQVQQEILNSDSSLYAFNPDVIALAFRSREFASDLYAGFIKLVEKNEVEESIESVFTQTGDLVRTIRKRSEAAIILHTFDPPPYPELGLVDGQLEIGQTAAFHRLNSRLAQLAGQERGVYLLDYAQLTARTGWEQWHDRRMWSLARMPLSAQALSILAEEYVSFLRPMCGLNRKCLVLDLDNTMWGGIIGEDGIDGIQIGHDFPGNTYRDFQRTILRLHDRGVILAVNSKNNENDALDVFDNHPEMLLRKDHFAAKRINWLDKATNMRELAQELNIGLDQMVFLDDNPVERELVRSQLPQVLVPELPDDPVEYVSALEGLRDFDTLAWSAEDRDRTAMYRAESSRRKLKEQVTSLDEFYASLDMEVFIGRADPISIPRIAQLTQRTNQFNLTTRRYSESDIACFSADSDAFVYHIRLVDRFGDSGIVGVAIIRIDGNCWNIDTLLMSCRVLGRTVEDAFLAYIAGEAVDSGAAVLRGSFIPTRKNGQVAGFYPDRGFTLENENGDATQWRLDLAGASLTVPSWIQLRVPEGASC